MNGHCRSIFFSPLLKRPVDNGCCLCICTGWINQLTVTLTFTQQNMICTVCLNLFWRDSSSYSSLQNHRLAPSPSRAVLLSRAPVSWTLGRTSMWITILASFLSPSPWSVMPGAGAAGRCQGVWAGGCPQTVLGGRVPGWVARRRTG